MTSNLSPGELHRKASKLVEFGFHPTKRPGHRNADREYQEAIDAYLIDPDFRTAVDSIAAGRGMSVLHVDDQGIILGAQTADHPNVMRPADLGALYKDPSERMTLAIVFLTITATLFPDEDALRDEDPLRNAPELSVQDIHARVRALAGQLAPDNQDSSDSDSGYVLSEHAEAWEVVREKADKARTGQGNHRATSLYNHVEKAFATLQDQGFVRARKDRGPGVYSPLRRFRIHAALLAAEGSLDAVRQANARLEALNDAETSDPTHA